MFSLPSYKPSDTAKTIKAKDTKANERYSYKYGYPKLNLKIWQYLVFLFGSYKAKITISLIIV